MTMQHGYDLSEYQHGTDNPLYLGSSRAALGGDSISGSYTSALVGAFGDALSDTSAAITAEEAITLAGLNWNVTQHKVAAIIEQPEPWPGAGPLVTHTQAPQYRANVRDDTGRVLGIVGDRYVPLQNREAFALADDIVAGGGASWVGAGETRGGARVHGVLRLNRDVRIAGNDGGEAVLPLLKFSNGHDGGLAVTIGVAPFRWACRNGMLLPVEGCSRVWKARHTRNVAAKSQEARRVLELAGRYYDTLQARSEQLVATPMSRGEFAAFLEQLAPFPIGPDHPDFNTDRRVHNVETVRDAIRSALRADDLANVAGTRWGAMQAVTNYATHGQRVRLSGGRTAADARFERTTEPVDIVDRAYGLLVAA